MSGVTCGTSQSIRMTAADTAVRSRTKRMMGKRVYTSRFPRSCLIENEMKATRLTVLFTLLTSTVLLSLPGTVLAQVAPDKKTVHCLSLSRIKDSEVISNRYILFRLQDNSTYVNVLSHACPGLNRNKAIMYRSSVGQLCDLDVITVLESASFGLMPGASCGLGNFQPIDEDGIASLRKAAKEGKL